MQKEKRFGDMKILVIEPCGVNFGGYYRAFNICSHLSNRRIKVDLLVSTRSNFQLSIKRKKINYYFTQYELPRFQLNFYFNGRVLRGLIGFFIGLTGKYDIIHVCVPVQLESNIPAIFLKLLNKKVIIDWDDYWTSTYRKSKNKILKTYINFCEKNIPFIIENIIVVSDFLKNLAKKRGAKKILKLVNGVNIDQFKLHTRENGFRKLKLPKQQYLLAFGNTYSKQRFLKLMKAYDCIYKLRPSIKLLFNHDPDYFIHEYKLEKVINREILDSIINVGQIKQQDLGYYFAITEATMFFAEDSDDEKACFPIRIGSYLNGESVIITNEIDSEVANTLKKYECAIISKDVKHLANKVVVFLNDKEKQRQMKNKVKIIKKELSWDTLINDLIKYYKSL